MHGALVAMIAAAAALPPPVHVREEPEGLPGARADFGRLGGSVYEIEIPDDWNGRLVLFMHGYGGLAPTTNVSPPGIRSYLIARGYAWAASSFSSTSLIPGRATDETAALWDFFARRYGRPRRTYVTGQSMGGAATHVAAERYANRFDGALALCGAASQTPAVAITSDFLAAAYAAGVTQREFDRRAGVGALIRDRILPALRRPRARRRFEDIMVSITGGPRPFDREGFRIEEETNWERAELAVSAGLATNRDTVYRLGKPSPVTSAAFNRAVIRFRTDRANLRAFVAGSETSGRLAMPLLSLHTTGDGQVPYEQARILQRRVDAAGRGRRLVQRVFDDPGHCGFTSAEWAASLEALVAWVERGVRPTGHDVIAEKPADLRPRFELSARPGTPADGGVPGVRRRVVLRGKLELDGAPLDARFLGAVVRSSEGLMTPCQLTLPAVSRGRYEITVIAEQEGSGCGAAGRRIELWAFAGDQIVYSAGTTPWPGPGRRATFHTSFSTAAPDGAGAPLSEFAGEAFRRGGRRLPGGTRVEAFVGTTLCGVTATRRTGSFSGFSLDVVGPDVIAGCARGGTLGFRVGGRRVAQTAVNEPGRHPTL